MKSALLVALLACVVPFAHAGGSVDAGSQKSKVCAACHGADFNTPISPDIPRLAGQHRDYIARALTDYKSGERKNPIMDAQAGALSKQDIEDLAAYIGSLKGSLKVIPEQRLAN
ncbi:MAG: c-type cytochrome [Burkholderiales bacterium]